MIQELSKRTLVTLYNQNKRRAFSKKIKKIARSMGADRKPLSNSLLDQHLMKWKQLQKKVDRLWYQVYGTVLGREDINFIPEDIYYIVVEPCLNNKQMLKGYSDKNSYEMLYSPALFPDVIIRNINGSFYDSDFNYVPKGSIDISVWAKDSSSVIVKPAIDSGGGHGVDLYSLQSGRYVDNAGQPLTMQRMEKQYRRDFVVQRRIEQHEFFRHFNPDSVNTVRIFTYRSVNNDEVIPLQALLRVGRKGSHVDNQASGGLSCGIDGSGSLNSFAIDKYGKKFRGINDVPLGKGIRIPFYDEMISLSKQIASRNYHARLLGLDLYVDKTGRVKAIEVNNVNNEINFYQMNNGALFGQYTDEIIDYCSQHLKSFVLDYYYE